MLSKKLLDVLTCPACKGKLVIGKNYLACKKCRLRFAIKDNIPDMLIEDAEKY